MDGKYNEEKWLALKNHVGGEVGEELVSALKEMYLVFDRELIDWMAGLYDPEIGGYYYSNSGRDNKTIEVGGVVCNPLPDAESTFQAINMWVGFGVGDGSLKWGKWIPEWLQKDICNFIYNLQDEDGFFYHPQWGKDIPLSRRARDFNWSKHILENLKGSLKYKTFLDIPKADKEETNKVLIPEHMKTEEAFASYLDSLNISERSYHSGNELTAQKEQMRVFGRLEQCYEYLIARLNENGHWHSVNNYYAINGLFKTSFIFDSTSRPHPRPIEAAKATIAAITSDEPMTAITDLYNTWYTIRIIVDNQRKFAGERAKEIIDTIHSEIWKIAPAAIRKSTEKLKQFKRSDSAFSYGPRHSSPTSQGVPVAKPGSDEGDVNATNISAGVVGNILIALGLEDYSMPLIDPSERERYIKLLEDKRDKIKG